jgi:hypothetical protein
MPKVPDYKAAPIRQAIRSEMAKDPLVTSRQLNANLDKLGYHISEDYMLKLVRKVTNEIEYEADNTDLQARLISTRERVILIIDRLMKIAFWNFEYLELGIGMPDLDQQMNAMRMIIDMDLALLRAELVGGMYKRKQGDADEFRRLLVDPDTKSRISGALRAWKLTAPFNATPHEAAQ